MTHADEMRAIALVVKKEKDARLAVAAAKYINETVLPAIKPKALEGKFTIDFELDYTGIVLKEAIKEQLLQNGYKIITVSKKYLTVEW